MASSEVTRDHVTGHDAIEFGAPSPAFQLPHHDQHHQQQGKTHSTSTNGAGTSIKDEKDSSLPVEQYAVDPEKQSSRVGSVAAQSGAGEKSPLEVFVRRHFYKAVWLIVWMLFTASVPPSLLPSWRAKLTAAAAADGGFTASSSTAIPTARDG